jgi:hypothetical protein
MSKVHDFTLATLNAMLQLLAGSIKLSIANAACFYPPRSPMVCPISVSSVNFLSTSIIDTTTLK